MTEQTEGAEVAGILALAAEIRRVDGNHDLGAAALAEALWPHLSDREAAAEARGAQAVLAAVEGAELSAREGDLVMQWEAAKREREHVLAAARAAAAAAGGGAPIDHDALAVESANAEQRFIAHEEGRPMSGLDIEGVLVAHQRVLDGPGSCRCGEWPPPEHDVPWTAHVAAVLRERIAAAQAEAWERGRADERPRVKESEHERAG